MPVEIRHMVLLQLDLATMDIVRCVNSHFRALVESLPAYKLLKEHANHTLCVIRKTRMAPIITIGALFTEFCQPSCRGCGAFGPFLFLPTIQRCCENCLQGNGDFQLVPLLEVQPNFGITQYWARKWLPVIYSPSGVFGDGWRNELHYNPRVFVSLVHIENLAREVDPSKEVIRRPIDWLQKWRCRGATDLPFWDWGKQTVESGVYCSDCSFHKIFSEYYGSVRTTGEGNSDAYSLETIPRHFERCEFLRRNRPGIIRLAQNSVPTSS
jgi:hypothetical protein